MQIAHNDRNDKIYIKNLLPLPSRTKLTSRPLKSFNGSNKLTSSPTLHHRKCKFVIDSYQVNFFLLLPTNNSQYLYPIITYINGREQAELSPKQHDVSRYKL